MVDSLLIRKVVTTTLFVLNLIDLANHRITLRKHRDISSLRSSARSNMDLTSGVVESPAIAQMDTLNDLGAREILCSPEPTSIVPTHCNFALIVP